ncbi:MAG TPA: S8 family serine peptidase [Actinophytocola sp.]|uniref:S8 family serine peptidase n=1 Tax=Actinophytocola sp. TaxID=1872138 RepID=UPI002DDD3A98|nr:S8 family serine peptidase [Actinophytocola sp.]HEV2784456.1 S8 family serine peptidase [Actinophytocola sp.]
MTSQRQWRRRGRIAVGMAFTTAIASVTLVGLSQPAAADPAPDEVSIGKHDEELLAQARQRGERTVKVLVATKDGAAAQGVDQLVRAGAKVEYRADEIGYVRAEVPVDSVKKVAALSGVQAIDLDENIPLEDPRPDAQADPTPQPPPDANTPRVNAYMPTGDTGAAQFVDAHPTWDGRGVTVGVLDTGIDFGHPSLNTTSTGERKITEWVTFTDGGFTNGVNNDNDPTWVLTSTTVPANYTLPPGGGTFRFGTFNERDPRFGAEMGNDANRDGNPPGSSGLFGVLWDTTSNQVWVDANQNLSFADEKAMLQYKVRNDIGEFGTDNPATPIRESMPFVVQVDAANNSVSIGVVSGAHGSHVAGIIAGNSLFGGRMSGAAPGAKLVSVRVCLFVEGCTSHALIEGMIYAARDANVDVINMSIGGLPQLNDANNARAALYNELIDTFDVQMFFSAGNNGSGVNTVGDPAVTQKVIAAGSYITKASWQRNYGSDATGEEHLHGFSSRGPAEDGGFKPNIVAPGSATSTVPTWQPGQPVAGAMTLPPGYGMFNGTSMASPQTAGAAALLVSAARARGVQHSAAQLRRAITSSARFIPGYQAYEQGNGLINVDRAWNLLQANIRIDDITGKVPVNTLLSPFLATPGVGVGIHDREGVRAGDRYSRDYTFVRNSGPDGPITYRVSWVGNDGTFSSPTAITLRKGFAVKFRVQINPRTVGVHSAIMNLDSPLTTGIEHQTLNTVVAAEDLTAENGFMVQHGGTIGRNQVTSHFVRVPPNTPALKVDLQGGGTAPGAGQIRFLRFHPVGVAAEGATTNSLYCYNPPVSPGGVCVGGTPTSRTATNPTPGVWEIAIEARRTSDVAFAPYTISAAALGAKVEPNPDVIPSAQLGVPVNRQYTLTNSFGTFTGRATGTPLGSARMATPTIANLEQQQFQIQVTPGTTRLRAKIGGTSDPAADLDLFVFDCSTGTCVQRGSSADGDSEEEVTITSAVNAGVWVVLVDGFAVPAGTTTYNYLDVFTNPAFGAVAVTDANAVRGSGTQWTVSGTVTAGTAPTSGRVLLGNVEVRTDTNVLVGSGDVIVQNVS